MPKLLHFDVTMFAYLVKSWWMIDFCYLLKLFLQWKNLCDTKHFVVSRVNYIDLILRKLTLQKLLVFADFICFSISWLNLACILENVFFFAWYILLIYVIKILWTDSFPLILLILFIVIFMRFKTNFWSEQTSGQCDITLV